MCGLIALRGNWPRGSLAPLIDNARRRGPDMFGIGWLTEGAWIVRHYLTPSWPERFCPEHDVEGPDVWAVGHARLATSGEPGALRDAQPLLIEGMMFSHNGTVYRHERLAERYGFALDTQNDSEALARLFLYHGYDPAQTMEALEEYQGRMNHAWIAASGDQMWIASWGQPLYHFRSRDREAVTSWRSLGAKAIPPGRSIVWNR